MIEFGQRCTIFEHCAGITQSGFRSLGRKMGKMLVNLSGFKVAVCSASPQDKTKQHKKQQSRDKITIQMRLNNQQLFSAFQFSGELVNPAACFSWIPFILLLWLTALSCSHVAPSNPLFHSFAADFTFFQQFAGNSQLEPQMFHYCWWRFVKSAAANLMWLQVYPAFGIPN